MGLVKKGFKKSFSPQDEGGFSLAGPPPWVPEEIPAWWRGIDVETDVQRAILDLCLPGATVFDVGAHMGALSVVMSRVVGPAGRVCAFEASPRNLEGLQRTLVVNGCGNVTVYPCAVGETTGKRLPFYYLPESHSDSLHLPPGMKMDAVCDVVTVALDDFAARTDLVPSFIKMDIERNEPAALEGAKELIRRHRPHLVLEVRPSTAECVDRLLETGYKAWDLKTFLPLEGGKSIPSEEEIRNILFFHPGTPARCRTYAGEIRQVPVAEFGKDRIRREEGPAFHLDLPDLGEGRFRFTFGFSGTSPEDILKMTAYRDGSIAALYIASSARLETECRDIVVDLPAGSRLSWVLALTQGGKESSFTWERCLVRRITGFEDLPSLPWIRP